MFHLKKPVSVLALASIVTGSFLTLRSVVSSNCAFRWMGLNAPPPSPVFSRLYNQPTELIESLPRVGRLEERSQTLGVSTLPIV